MVVVQFGIIVALGIIGPDAAAIGALDYVVDILAGRQVADTDGVILRALPVGRPH
jgi:hypothetical protein